MATITVQTILNRATYVNVTVNLTDTILTLKTAVESATGVDTDWFDIYYNNSVLDNTKTLNFYSIPSGATVGAVNLISSLATKQLKQEAKLALAQLRRQAAGDTSANYYRYWNTSDVNSLPTKYVGDNVFDNLGSLVDHRPWTGHS